MNFVMTGVKTGEKTLTQCMNRLCFIFILMGEEYDEEIWTQGMNRQTSQKDMCGDVTQCWVE